MALKKGALQTNNDDFAWTVTFWTGFSMGRKVGNIKNNVHLI